ncbi:hypothetical protein EN788_40965, partial [Mesorhizobium sp. M2D.F.Ca.ET.145.01.1.1]
MDHLDWKTFVPWAISIATVLLGIWQYSDKQAQANREPFLKEQTRLLFEASETVSTLANTTDPAVWKNARSRFWTLYWGPLSLVEDVRVENCMVKLGEIIPPTKQAEIPALPFDDLRTASYELAHIARNLMIKSWDAKLDMKVTNSFSICKMGRRPLTNPSLPCPNCRCASRR